MKVFSIGTVLIGLVGVVVGEATVKPGLVRMGVVATQSDTHPLSKRQFSSPLLNDLKGLMYLISFRIGNPPQNVTVALDTGSSDTWVDPTCEEAARKDKCRGYNRYKPEVSSSARNVSKLMTIYYGSGRAMGHYFVDDLWFGGAKIQQAQFGVAYSTARLDTGLMGLSFGNGPGPGPNGNMTDYPNVIDQLYEQNVTNIRAFSLDLGGVDTPEGSIIFGGLDTKKFHGPLVKFPMIPTKDSPEQPDPFTRYWLNLSSITITPPNSPPQTVLSSPLPVFLDSGNTLSILPQSLVDKIVPLFTDIRPNGDGIYIVPCSTLNLKGSVEFGFGNLTITVPYRHFIWDAGSACVLGFIGAPDNSGTWVLGDTFLRGAFVVFDQDNYNIHIASSADCGSNLVAFGRGKDAVLSVMGECTAPSFVRAPVQSAKGSLSLAATGKTTSVKGTTTLKTTLKATTSSKKPVKTASVKSVVTTKV